MSPKAFWFVCLNNRLLLKFPLVMPENPLAPLPLHSSPVPAYCVLVVPDVRVLVAAFVNHFCAVIPIVKLASVGHRGSVWSKSGCVRLLVMM